jgi:hypothetical protein
MSYCFVYFCLFLALFFLHHFQFSFLFSILNCCVFEIRSLMLLLKSCIFYAHLLLPFNIIFFLFLLVLCMLIPGGLKMEMRMRCKNVFIYSKKVIQFFNSFIIDKITLNILFFLCCLQNHEFWLRERE